MEFYELSDDPIPAPRPTSARKSRYAAEVSGQSLRNDMWKTGEEDEETALSTAADSSQTEGGNLAPSSMLLRRPHPGPVYSVSIRTPEEGEPMIVTGGRDGIVRLYHLEEENEEEGAEPFLTFEGHSDAVMCLTTYRPPGGEGGVVVVSGSKDKSVRVWVVATKSSFHALFKHTDTVWCVQVAQPTDLEPVIVSAGLDGNVEVWSLLRGELMRTIIAIPKSAKDRRVFSLAIYYGEDGESASPGILSGGEDQIINLWSIETGEVLKTFIGHSDAVVSLAVCHHYLGDAYKDAGVLELRDTLFASGSKDGTVRIWSVKTTEMLRVLRGHNNSVLSVFFLPQSFYFYYGERHHELALSSSRNLGRKLVGAVGRKLLAKLKREEEDSGGGGSVGIAGGSERNRPKSAPSRAADQNAKLDAESVDNPLRRLSTAWQRQQQQQEATEEEEASAPGVPYVVDLAILSSGKDGRVFLWNLATGKTMRSMHHHSSAATAVCGYEDKERQQLKVVTASVDASVATLTISTASCITSAEKAYENDKNGRPLPPMALALVPDEFQRWGHTYLLIQSEKMSVDEFFAGDQFFLFSRAILDRCIDFVELFLPLSPTGLVTHSQDRQLQAAGVEGAKTGKDRTLSASSVASSLAGGDNYSDLDLAQIAEAEALHLKNKLLGLKDNIRGVLAFDAEGDDGALRGIENASILRLAVARGDIRLTLCILDAWRRLVNAPPRDWMEQCRGPFTRLPKRDLVALAYKFPLIFQNFITSLRLQPAHNLILRECTAVIPVGKHYLKKGGTGCLTRDIDTWKVSGQKMSETMVAQYLPLAHAADLDMLRAFTRTCSVLDSVEIFQSEVGAAAIKFAWSKFGIEHHRYRVCFYIFFIAVFVLFAITDPYSSSSRIASEDAQIIPAYLLVVVVIVQLCLHVQQCLFEQQSIWRHFFTQFWPFLDLLGAVFIGYTASISLSEDREKGGQELPRFLMSINLLIQMLATLSFFRAFESTGPLVSMIIRICYDIRFYLFLLAVILFGFSLSFWCLCSNEYYKPDQVTLLNNITTASAVWYTTPVAGNDDPQGSYAFASLQGAYMESFVFLTGQFSIEPFSGCGYDDTVPGRINHSIRGFAIFLAAVFAVLVQLMMVNVLIALMTESYGRLSERGVAQARLMQAQLICESAGAISKSLARKKQKNPGLEDLQPKIVYLLRRAADLVHEGDLGNDDDGPSVEEVRSAASVVAKHTDAHAERIEGILRGTVTEIDSVLGEQDDAIYELRRNIEALAAKTKRILTSS